ncbi:hypothetical protein EDD21DRAFT_137473 [Dissophora ornata]|nr:hypothetical protein BGZ58_005693 [Dissophora ornata]KAI8600297.1 hypothetical protein EDD21DRAFT_137473 [Dissophora ornata]
MTVKHIAPNSADLLTLREQHQLQDSRKKGAILKGSLSTAMAHLSKIITTSSAFPSIESNSPVPKLDSPSSPPRTPLVFKKPTKHQFSWSELSEMVASKDLKPMGRSEAVQDAYQKAIKRRTKKYGSPDEYIRQRVLHWPPAEDIPSVSSPSSDGNESSTSCSSASPPSSPTGPVDPLEVTLKKNEFPYSVKPGIEHWLIWSRLPLTDEDWIRKYLEERLPGRDFLFFINPPELRSVPSIFHVQVFTKGEGEVLDEEDMEVKRAASEGSA